MKLLELPPMRDLIFVAYSLAWIGLAWSVKRVPFWQPRVVRFGDASFVPDQRPAGCMMLLFLLMGAVIGMGLPLAISDILPRDPTRFYEAGTSGLDGFGRMAVLVGGLRGGYVGLRGSRLWTVLLVVGGALYVASATLGWVLRGF